MNTFETLRNSIGKKALYLGLIQAIISFLGSMTFSNILMYPPCVLCWYQRIFMFPLSIILMVGILRKDILVHLYVLPLALMGWTIALYHNLLYYKIIPDTIAPCSTGVSCTVKYVEYFGFITIPLLSFVAFSIIIVLMCEHQRFIKHTSITNSPQH
jgi:disulfide bond formation protein DsbB